MESNATASAKNTTAGPGMNASTTPIATQTTAAEIVSARAQPERFDACAAWKC
ncbi:MAG TPA: hypothetical protein VFN67_15535 [Polyangiales bacterium]|nr:hypothetical protein [Polyangiales bacterium]